MTSVADGEGSAMEDLQAFALEQNWPNPFNACTAISYVLPKSASARLMVYDVLGRQVAVLASGYQEAGAHQVQWEGMDREGGNASSGVYFVRLEAPELALTKRMILLK